MNFKRNKLAKFYSLGILTEKEPKIYEVFVLVSSVTKKRVQIWNGTNYQNFLKEDMFRQNDENNYKLFQLQELTQEEQKEFKDSNAVFVSRPICTMEEWKEKNGFTESIKFNRFD